MGGYTGELYIYRVDDAWAPNGEDRTSYKIGDYSNDKNKQMREWVPVRKKNDVSGLDGHDRIVTKKDFVKVTLRNVFIKYFKEIGKKGEVAFILSFACGNKHKEDLLVYASKSQTLGTSLALDDITIIGPEKLIGENLRMRIVMIEIDKIENEAMKNLIKQTAGIAATIQPQYTAAIKIAGDLAQFIISSNEDDIIFDRTFELTMTNKGQSVNTTPLLYGNYILLLQEDRFQSKDVNKKTPIATRPPSVDDMRFNLYDNKLYHSYIYRPELLDGREKFTALDFLSPDSKNRYDLGSKVVDMNQFYLYSKSEDYEKDDSKHSSVLDTINGTKASEFRHKVLAFPKADKTAPNYRKLLGDKIGDFDILGTLGDTLVEIYCESVRYNNEEMEGRDACKGAGSDLIYPHYPIYLYPQGYTILAQYPFHTHIVLSVSRSVGTTEKPVEDKISTFTEWLKTASEEAAVSTEANKLVDDLKKNILSQSALNKIMKKAAGESDPGEKKCIIVRAIYNDRIIEKNSLYNELYHITGDTFTEANEVKKKYAECLK
jgi:hypothetical protein